MIIWVTFDCSISTFAIANPAAPFCRSTVALVALAVNVPSAEITSLIMGFSTKLI